jgi:hypothetical protein
MRPFAFCRASEHFFAPLCEERAEGAQATEGGQDKRDSLRLSRAVVLVLLVNIFAQAAYSRRSLFVSTSRYTDSPFFTLPDSCHVS